MNVCTLGSDDIRMSIQKLREKFFYDIGVIDGQILVSNDAAANKV